MWIHTCSHTEEGLFLRGEDHLALSQHVIMKV